MNKNPIYRCPTDALLDNVADEYGPDPKPTGWRIGAVTGEGYVILVRVQGGQELPISIPYDGDDLGLGLLNNNEAQP